MPPLDPRDGDQDRQANVATRPGDVGEADTPLVCAACRVVITHEAAAISRDGKHQHVCANPAGKLFVVRCFASAQNLSALGFPTSTSSWFAGYGWRIVTCAGCQSHMGWYFTGEAPFFGLIAGNLRAAEL